MLFVAADLIFAMAIPFVAISGYHTLLDSKVGQYEVAPTRDEPGWSALVEPTDIAAAVEVHNQSVTGVALLITHAELDVADTVILLPGSLEIDGQTLADRAPADAVTAISGAARIAISSTIVLDDKAWTEAFGSRTIPVDNPDPVTGVDDQPIFDVGSVVVTGATASAFLGRPTEGASLVSVTPRRHLLWNALVAHRLDDTSEIGRTIEKLDSENSQILDMPMTQLEPISLPDFAATESLVRDVTAFPAGSVPGDRLQIRIIDRTGGAPLEDIAAVFASRGIEVLEIGNTSLFDQGETQIVVPIGLDIGSPEIAGGTANGASPKAQLDDLLDDLDLSSVVDPEDPSGYVATILIGSDFDLASLY